MTSSGTRGQVTVRRIYDDVDAGGARVLVDGLWPRGVSKEDADLTRWPKDVAPSDDLRSWFDHDPDRFDEFRDRYRDELDEGQRAEALDGIVTLTKQGGVVLLTATKDVEHSHAVVLAEVVRDRVDG